MPRLNPTTFRLTREDLAIMDEARRRFGLASRTEALRYLLRLWDGSVAVLHAAYASGRGQLDRNAKQRPSRPARRTRRARVPAGVGPEE